MLIQYGGMAGYGARQRQPMHFARSLGPRRVLEGVRKYQKLMTDVPHWVPASGLTRSIPPCAPFVAPLFPDPTFYHLPMPLSHVTGSSLLIRRDPLPPTLAGMLRELHANDKARSAREQVPYLGPSGGQPHF